MLNDILLKLKDAGYMMIIDAILGKHNLKLNKKSSFLTTFACQFGRYQFTRLPVRVGPVGDMFQ